MNITGKLIKILEPVTGEGKFGQWRKQNFVIETDDEYPKKICFTAWGDKVDFSSLTESDTVKVFFDIESREFKENWYTDLKAWKAEVVQPGNKESFPQPPPVGEDDIPPDFTEENGDDLPF